MGENDALKPPESSRRIAGAIPDSELVVVPEAGHAVVLERPERVNAAVMGFLARHAGHGVASFAISGSCTPRF